MMLSGNLLIILVYHSFFSSHIRKMLIIASYVVTLLVDGVPQKSCSDRREESIDCEVL